MRYPDNITLVVDDKTSFGGDVDNGATWTLFAIGANVTFADGGTANPLPVSVKPPPFRKGGPPPTGGGAICDIASSESDELMSCAASRFC